MLKRQIERFFRWYCKPEYYEDILGDLNELYSRKLKSTSKRSADWFFIKEVLWLFRPNIIHPINFFSLSNSRVMIANHVKLGLRNLRKHPFYSLIHVMGLALGLAAFLYINRYTEFEKSYDNFHFASEQLYRLTTDDIRDGKIQVRDAMSFAPSGSVLVEDVPEIVRYTTTFKTFRMIFRKDGQAIEENQIVAVDSNFLDLFQYEILQGDKETLFNDPYNIVLTEKLAKKYFGSADPIGQSIHVLGSFNRPFVVTGLLKDTPENTHYKFNSLVSLKSYQEQIDNDNWNGFNYYTYLQLAPSADLAQVRAKLPALSRKYLGDDSRLEFNIQPVLDIHLHSDFTYEPEIHGSAKAVSFLGIISLFILLIAWVNYINLSTARAMERAKEVGLRKMVGATKSQLVGQFLLESLMVNLVAAAVAASLAQAFAPQLNEIAGKTLITTVWTDTAFMSKLLIFFALGTLVTGYYPALVLSSFRPIGVLKGSFGRSSRGALMRKALVILQFSASLILIASTAVIYKQIQFMVGKDLGINPERVIGFDNPGSRGGDYDQYVSKYKSFSDEVSKINGVESVGGISNLPGGGSSDISSTSSGVTIIGMTDRAESTVYRSGMNDRLHEALGFELLAGRNFDHDLATDTAAVIVNESLLKLLNISNPADVINQYLQFGTSPENRRYLIAGVMKDYNRSSLKNNVEPTVFQHRETPAGTIVKLSDQDNVASIQAVSQVWSEFFPESPFVHTFIDQRFEKLYLEDKKFGTIFLVFSLLAILVASLGLFGLSSYLSLQRAKEVGIRKVLGASVSNIVILFFRDFMWLILIAVGIGVPLIFSSMSNWLEGYAYRINFPWLMIFVAVVVVAVFAFVTVSLQTWKLAILNPSKTIRHE